MTVLVEESRQSARSRPLAYLGQEQPSVQRLMTAVAFKEKTELFGKIRWRIRAVDNALEAYERITPITHENALAKRASLVDLRRRCETYLALETAKRKEGVRTLMQEIAREMTFIDPLADSLTAALPERFSRLVEAQDAFIRLRSQGHPPHGIVAMDPWFMDVITDLWNNPDAMTQVLQNEVGQLRAIRDNPVTPGLTRAILTEVLDEAPPGVTFAPAIISSTAGFVDPADPAQGYAVEHQLNAARGTAERLGSLAHELTHVSVSKTFRNTPLFLAFRAGAHDDEILELSATRTAQLQELQDILGGDENFDPYQKQLLIEKLEYPWADPTGIIMRYVPRFRPQLGEDLYARLQGLAGKGLNNTVIEFDTVINQMMVYMHQWGVPEASMFYTRLREVAREAYEYRAAARAEAAGGLGGV